MSFPQQSPNGFPFWEKAPNAVKDYVIDWTDWLNGDTIQSSTWTLTAGITKDSDTHTLTSTTIWISGGSVSPNFYRVTNKIVTVGGRTEERSFELKLKVQ